MSARGAEEKVADLVKRKFRAMAVVRDSSTRPYPTPTDTDGEGIGESEMLESGRVDTRKILEIPKNTNYLTPTTLNQSHPLVLGLNLLGQAIPCRSGCFHGQS
jgi:hypothetical protein